MTPLADESSQHWHNGVMGEINCQTDQNSTPEDLPAHSTSSKPSERSQSRGKRGPGPGRTSCFECRRRKLKCDEKLPCHQCIKRGITHLCPNGHVKPGGGHRIFWDNTTEHHEKIAVCRDRIKDLEDALRSAHSVVSHEPHPLLSDELLQIKDTGKLPAGDSDIKELEEFGSLSLSHDGNSNFYGHAATSWLFMNNDEGSAASWSMGLGDTIPLDLFLSTSGSFHSGWTPHTSRNENLELLVRLLPPQQRVFELTADAFNDGFVSMYPIQRDEFRTHIYEPLYEHSINSDHPLLAPRLAVIYALLAHGAQSGVSVNRVEAEQYLHLSSAAMKHSNLIDAPSIEGIQAVLLMSLYLAFSDTATRNTSNRRFILAGFLMRLCQITGLHSDPSRYDLDPAETKRRRLLFAEVYSNDITQTLWLSRPPAMAKRFFDVKPHSDDSMNAETHYHIWKYKFAIECLSVVQDQAYSASPPSYSTVIALSHQVENYPAFAPVVTNPDQQSAESTLRAVQTEISRGQKEDVLLHIHRRFCLLATEKYRDEPLQCEYGTSVVSAYRSASRIVLHGESLMTQPDAHRALRFWTTWARLYDSATMLGTIVIRCPNLPFAVDAYTQLRNSCTMMHAVRESLQAEKAYDKLVQTLDLAHKSLFTYTNKLPIPTSIKDAEAEALLAKLGAKPQVTIRPGRLLNRTGSSIAAPHPPYSQQRQPPIPMLQPPAASSHQQLAQLADPPVQPVDSGVQDMFSQLPMVPGWDVTPEQTAILSGLTDTWNTTIGSSAPPSSGGHTWDNQYYQHLLWDGISVDPTPGGMAGYPLHHEMPRQSMDQYLPPSSQFDGDQTGNGSVHFK